MRPLLLLALWTARGITREALRHRIKVALLLPAAALFASCLLVIVLVMGGTNGGWGVRPLLLGGTCLLLLQLTCGAWLFPPRLGLAFTPGEVNFVFPAPVSRSALLLTRILVAQPGLLLLALLFGFMVPLPPEGRRLDTVLGLHLCFSFVYLNRLAVSLATVPRADGRSGPLRALVASGLLLGLLLLVWRSPGPELWAEIDLEAVVMGRSTLARTLSERLGTWAAGGAPALVLAPFRALGELVAPPPPDAQVDALARWGWALLVVALPTAYVFLSRVDFQEAALQASEVWQLRREQMRHTGRWEDRPRGALPPPPLPLELHPDPTWGLAWKGLAGITRVSLSRYLLGALVLVGLALAAIWTPLLRPWCLVGAAVAYGTTGLTLMMAGEVGHPDLRAAMKRAAWLKALPLPGWRVFLGEALASTLASWATASLFLVLAAILADPLPGAPAPLTRALGALGGVMALLPVFAFLVVVTNVGAVGYPGLFGSFPPRTLVAVLGMYLLMALRPLLLGLAAMPAGLLAVGVLASGWLAAGPFALPLAGAAFGLVLAAETALLVALGGRWLDAWEPIPV